MLATLGPLPEGPGWAFEAKWDGIRAVLYVDDPVRILTRNDHDVTGRFPRIAAHAARLGVPMVLDGEIVALDPAGRPDFGVLTGHTQWGAPGPRWRRARPAQMFAFDVLYHGDRSLLALPYVRRRALLDDLGLTGGPISAPPAFTGDGPSVWAAAGELGLEGVVAKRLDSAYHPGVRTRAWIKVPRLETVDVMVGGWTPGAGRRTGRIGALLVGIPAPEGLLFAGAVGTGFTDAELARLQRLLATLRIDTAPFANPVPAEYARHATWVTPRVTGQVRYRNWTPEGLFRHPSWRRTDSTG